MYGLDDVVDLVIKEAAPKGYRDNAVLVTLKVLDRSREVAGTSSLGCHRNDHPRR